MSRSGSSTSTTSCSSAARSRCPTPGRRPGSTPASWPPLDGLRNRLLDLAGGPVRGGRRRAGHQGPAAGVVPRPLAGGRHPLRRDAVYVTMLRPVTEVVGSKQLYYSGGLTEVSRTAAWVNMMLHTERATRGGQRAFVRYDDLLDRLDRPAVRPRASSFDLESVRTAQRQRHPPGPQLHRPHAQAGCPTPGTTSYVPDRLRELADGPGSCSTSWPSPAATPPRWPPASTRCGRATRPLRRGGRHRPVHRAGLAPARHAAPGAARPPRRPRPPSPRRGAPGAPSCRAPSSGWVARSSAGVTR